MKKDMDFPDERTSSKSCNNAVWRKRWDVAAAACIAIGSIAALSFYGDLRLVAFSGVLFLVALLLITCPRLLGQGLPRWVDRPTPPTEVYASGWLVLLGIAAAVAAYVYYHAGQEKVPAPDNAACEKAQELVQQVFGP
ncbi:MAG: hypothetical protein GXX96_24030 [Planctomycetaceae bacterium]|mgnify:CR=1 FL=1|nr:hypothetical protein [Planctomycetaceae bacterium]